ncbi:class I SAM-dependent methyltransferase [Caulifigura coniformis]
MPSEDLWRTFFDPDLILKRLGLKGDHQCVVDLGCGFGTFAAPAAALVDGFVYAFDIDVQMVEATQKAATTAGLKNLIVTRRDFVEQGSGLPDGSADFVMLFNILHAAEAGLLLQEAQRVLTRHGILAVIHWNHDPSTPRGPSMEIRLRPGECLRTVASAGFVTDRLLDLPPFHYGFAARKP